MAETKTATKTAKTAKTDTKVDTRIDGETAPAAEAAPPKPRKTQGSVVLARLQADRKKAHKSSPVEHARGRKGAEQPAEEEATTEKEERVHDKGEAAKTASHASHMSSTSQRRIGGDIASRGRIRQARRDSKNR